MHRTQGVPCRRRQPLHVEGIRQVCQDPIGHAVPQAVPCPDKPPAGPGGPPIQPGGRPLPQLLCRVIKVQNAPCMTRKALLKQAPQPASAITEPDHLRWPGRCPGGSASSHRRGFEHLNVTQDCHQAAPCSRVTHWVGPRAMLAQTGQHTHFDLAPAGSSPVGHRHRVETAPVTPSAPRAKGKTACSAVNGWASAVISRDGGDFFLEVLHGLLACRLHPTPHRAWAHRTATIPAQQSRRRGKRHKDCERTAQPLELPTGPLMGPHSQRLVQRGHLWDVHTMLGTLVSSIVSRHRRGPNRLVS